MNSITGGSSRVGWGGGEGAHKESLVVLIIVGKMSRTITVTGGEYTAGLDDVKRSVLMSTSIGVSVLLLQVILNVLGCRLTY